MTLDSILALATGATAIVLVLTYERRNEQFRQLTAKCFTVQGNAVIENISRVAALEEHLGVQIEFQEEKENEEPEAPGVTSSAALLETGE